MKKAEIKIGEIYLVKVSEKIVKVRVDSLDKWCGWLGTNLATGREVRMRTAAKMRATVDCNELA